MVDLRESRYYQILRPEFYAIGYEAGRRKVARKAILSLGTRKFGIAPSGIETIVESIAEVAILEKLTLGLLDVSSWEDLFAGVWSSPTFRLAAMQGKECSASSRC